jgi:hypothetical protein
VTLRRPLIFVLSLLASAPGCHPISVFDTTGQAGDAAGDASSDSTSGHDAAVDAPRVDRARADGVSPPRDARPLELKVKDTRPLEAKAKPEGGGT